MSPSRPRSDALPGPTPTEAAATVVRRMVYLGPGQLFASAESAEASMIVGSCVTVCLWEPRLRAGGANHFLLPLWVGNGLSSPRYGNVAVERLIRELQCLGCRTQDLQAKLFGGAAVIEAFRDRPDHLGFDLGFKNVELARRLLREHGIPVVAEDVGGHRGRKVTFDTQSGVASVRLI